MFNILPCAVLWIARYCWVMQDGPAYNISLWWNLHGRFGPEQQERVHSGSVSNDSFPCFAPFFALVMYFQCISLYTAVRNPVNQSWRLIAQSNGGSSEPLWLLKHKNGDPDTFSMGICLSWTNATMNMILMYVSKCACKGKFSKSGNYI